MSNRKPQVNLEYQIQMPPSLHPSPPRGEGKGEGNEESKFFSLYITERDQNKRLDQFISETDLHLSRSQAKHLITKNLILLNQKQAKPSSHLKPGDIVSITLPKLEPLSIKPEPLPLAILYEDASIIVVDKPAGMVVHPGAGNNSGTLVNALLYHCRDLAGINGVLRPGIVHRLDKDTSGVMVVAKDDEAYHRLAKQFKNRDVKKVYLAIVHGQLHREEGLIDSAIGRHSSERKRMSTRSRRGKAAITRWKRAEDLNDFTLLEIYPQTGRTHQIRVHLSSIGHPLLGDPLYGRKRRLSSIQKSALSELSKRMNRQALHALRLGFNHPRTQERVQFESPLPQDMSDVLQWLRKQSSRRPLSLDRRGRG
jgi:23S rRNA pseudouridine1911/1915/1917 synthase